MKKLITVIALAVFCATFVFGCEENPTDSGLVEVEGTLTVEVDPTTPTSCQLIMGEVNVVVAKFRFTAANEDILVTALEISDFNSAGAWGSIKNIRMYEGNILLGIVQFSTGSFGAGQAGAVYYDLESLIPKGETKIFTFKADVCTAADGATSGSIHTFALLADGLIVAKGVSSGQPVNITYGRQMANPMTVYRTKIQIEWASGSPSGPAIGSSAQTIAKVRVTNVPNHGNYTVTIKYANVRLATNISNTAARALTVYKDNTSTVPLGITNWIVDGDTRFDDSMTDVEIAAGASKLLIFTLDTIDGNQTGKDFYLDVGMGQHDIVWDDNAGNTITTVDTLPLVTKRLTY